MDISLESIKLENHIYYVQQLNMVLSRIYQSKKPGSLFMIKLNKQISNDTDIFNKAIKIFEKYDFDHIGNIRNVNIGDLESDDHIIAAHKLRDSQKGVDALVKDLSNDLSKNYEKDNFKIKGILYKGNKEMSAEQTLKKLNSSLKQ